MPRTKTSKLDTPKLGDPKPQSSKPNFKTIAFNPNDHVKLVIDYKTTVYVPKGKDLEKVRQKWLKILHPQKKVRLNEYVSKKTVADIYY